MRPKRDRKTGRWKVVKGATITAKGYMRITAGPYRNVYCIVCSARSKLGIRSEG